MNIKELKQSFDYLFEAQVTPFIWGHAGIGKTEVTREYAKTKGYGFFSLYLGTQADLGDVLGLQEFVRDAAGNPIATTFAMPIWLKNLIDYCTENPASGAVLFLDELPRARRDILQGMFSLALDKTFHTIKLPKNCYIVAAGNPPTDEYIQTEMSDTALMSRFVHIKLEPTFDEFITHAKESGVTPTLVGFFQDQPGFLNPSKSSFDLPVKPDNRAAFRADKVIKAGTPPELLKHLLRGIIGLEATVAYEQFLSKQDKPLSGVEVLKGNKIEVVREWSSPGNVMSSNLTVTCDNLVAYFKENPDTALTKKQKDNLLAFYKIIPKDIAYNAAQNTIMADTKAFISLLDDEEFDNTLSGILQTAEEKNNKPATKETK